MILAGSALGGSHPLDFATGRASNQIGLAGTARGVLVLRSRQSKWFLARQADPGCARVVSVWHGLDAGPYKEIDGECRNKGDTRDDNLGIFHVHTPRVSPSLGGSGRRRSGPSGRGLRCQVRHYLLKRQAEGDVNSELDRNSMRRLQRQCPSGGFDRDISDSVWVKHP